MKNGSFYPRGRDILGAVLLIIIGTVLLIHPDLGSAALAMIFGWGLLSVGGLGLVVCLFSWPVCSWPELGICLLGGAMGVYLLINPLSLASVLGVGLGAAIGIRCVSSAMGAMERKRRGWSWIPGMVLAVMGLILAAVLIFSPMSTSRIVMRACGVGMVIWGILRLIIRSGPGGEHDDPNIVDADI